MAPEMNKQFSKIHSNNCFIMDDIVNECDDLNQYIEKIDALIESKYVR